MCVCAFFGLLPLKVEANSPPFGVDWLTKSYF